MFGKRRNSKKTLQARHSFAVEALESRKMFAADVVSLTPADDLTNVDPSAPLRTSWSDPIQIGPGTGNIYLYNEDTHSLIETINVRSENVVIDGTDVTITPSVPLPANTNISVRVDPAKYRDLSTEITNSTIYFEDFENVELQNSTLVPPFNEYVVVMTGTLDVTEAGAYTFGINSDDGQTLAIDLDQNGLDLIDDEIIYDNNTHGRQDRLSTCAFEDNDKLQSCADDADDAITLKVGQYDFQYFFFDAGGGAGGEFFYAKDQQVAWNADAFVLVGDSSQGIGLVDGITVTTYKESGANEINDLLTAESVIEDDALIIGEAKIELADIAENRGGRFDVDNEIPGAADWVIANDPNPFDYANEGPYGTWTNDNSKLPEGVCRNITAGRGSIRISGLPNKAVKAAMTERAGSGHGARRRPGRATTTSSPRVASMPINACRCSNRIPNAELFSASVSTPTIYLDGVQENSAVLKFASSWWDEDTQSAEGRVNFYDADGNLLKTDTLFRWESIQASENYKPQLSEDGINARNEQIEIALENPAEAASMVIVFDMPYATNDWWWAIDNVEVTADVQGAVSGRIADNTTWNFTTGEASATPPGWTVGDFDGNGQIAFSDFQILSTNFGKQTANPTDGDANEDGQVSFADFQILSTNFGKSVDEVFAQMA